MLVYNLGLKTKEELEIDDLIEPSTEERKAITSLFSFKDLPSQRDLIMRAEKLAEIVVRSGCHAVMVEVPSYLIAPLEQALIKKEIKPVYPFFKSEFAEVREYGGSKWHIHKKEVTFHAGWIAPYGL